MAAIAALLSNRSIDEAARSINVAAKTLYRWLKEPAFDAAYRKARRDAFGQTIARLQQGSPAAASVLLKIVVDANAPASTRVRAAEIVLDKAAKAIELEDVEVRPAVLERAGEKPGRGGDRTMRMMTRRILRLEERLVPQEDPHERRLAEVLSERRRRRLGADLPAEGGLPPLRPEDLGRHLSLAEILRLRRERRTS